MSKPEHAALGDAGLADLTRAGEVSAYAELWQRHAGAGMAAARQFASIADPDDIVSEAYLQILRALQRGGGPHESFRPYLYRTIRNVALGWNQKAPPYPVELSDDIESRAPGPEESVIGKTITVRAFRTLPERWQTVLWYTEVEGMEPADAAPYLGLTANSAAALAYRAREGLRKAWLQAHVSDRRVPEDCRWTTERMSDYVRIALSPRARIRFEAHLENCTHCSILVEEVEDLGGRLGVFLLPLVLGGVAGSALLAEMRDSGPSRLATTATATLRPKSKRLALSLAVAALGVTAILVGAYAAPMLFDSAPPASVLEEQGGSDSGGDSLYGPEATDDLEPVPRPSEKDELVPPPASVAPPPKIGVAHPPPVVLPPVVQPPLDTTAPVAPTVVSPTDGLLTNDPRPTFVGSGEPGARIEASLDSVVASTIVANDGSWSLRPALPVADGVRAFQFVQVDNAGNLSPTSVLTLTIDTVAAAPTFQPLPAELFYLPELVGHSEPGATVDVSQDGEVIGTVVAEPDGAWALSVPEPGHDGAILTVRQTDLAGNVSADSVPSEPMVFERPSLVSPSDSAVIPSTAGATSVELEIAGLEGMQVQVLIDGVPTGNIHTLEAQPIIRATAPLSDGQHTVALRYYEPGTARVGSLVTHTITITP